MVMQWLENNKFLVVAMFVVWVLGVLLDEWINVSIGVLAFFAIAFIGDTWRYGKQFSIIVYSTLALHRLTLFVQEPNISHILVTLIFAYFVYDTFQK